MPRASKPRALAAAKALEVAVPESGNMLELLCTVAGHEANDGGDGDPSSPDSGAGSTHHHAVRRVESGRSLDDAEHSAAPASSENGGSANDRLASALAGVGAAGSLARIRQQSAALTAANPSLWAHDAKRQRVGL